MESTPVSRKRVRNRKRKRHLKSKRLDHDRVKFEVRSAKRQKFIAGCSVYSLKEKLLGKSMEAKAFWQNYTTAQQWQQTHNVVWWRTRCLALEQENQVLRDTVRSLARLRQCQCQRTSQVHNKVQNKFYNDVHQCQSKVQDQFQSEVLNECQSNIQNRFQNVEEAEDELASDDESLEFQLNEDMMDFLKQSIQHKMELQQKREKEKASEREEEEEEVPFQGGAAWMKKRTESAKLLYGEASPRILGMETALQTTIDRHKDKARPQYWPNIPLKL